MSANKPITNVKHATASPSMVRYCQCQPHDRLIKEGKSLRYLKDNENATIPSMWIIKDVLREGEGSRCKGCRDCRVLVSEAILNLPVRSENGDQNRSIVMSVEKSVVVRLL